MDRAKIQEKLKKIKELSERGVGGEKETAKQMYEKLLLKYGMDDSEICDVVRHRYVKYKDELSKRLVAQIYYKVTGCSSYSIMRDKRIKQIAFDCTDFEFDEIMFYYNFYIKHLREELDVFIRAFFNVNSIFPNSSARCYTDDNEDDDHELTAEELARLEKMFAMAKGMEKKTPLKQLEDKH